MTPESRLRIAIHESGHAVIGHSLGCPPLRMWLHQEATPLQPAGGCEFPDESDLVCFAIRTLAGYCSERIILGLKTPFNASEGCRSDYDAIIASGITERGIAILLPLVLDVVRQHQETIFKLGGTLFEKGEMVGEEITSMLDG